MTFSLFSFFLLLAFSSIAGFSLTCIAASFLAARAQMDVPNGRSMHKTPVPRGGGIAVIALVIFGLMAVFGFQKIFFPQAWILVGLLLLSVVSWYDDRKGGISAVLRLSFHLLAAALSSLALPEETTLTQGLLPFWLDRTVMIVGWAWFINLYNFMDGIDGITGAETIALSLGAGLLLVLSGEGDTSSYTLVALLAGSCLGFLGLNWHPARVFLGDVGSVPLGLATGYLLLQLVAADMTAAAFILPLYYLADSGITILRRALRGEKIWLPHREHFYQKAAQGLGRHDKVVIAISLANLLLLLSAVGSLSYPWAGLTIAGLVVTLLLLHLHKSMIVK